jgi:glycosyltransferase involved in cell wall biosynthesis
VGAGDVGELADALDAVLSGTIGSTRAEERRLAGLRVAAARTWDASAAIHMDAYRTAIAARLRS